MSDATRLTLNNVPRIHFYEGGQECPEDFPFPSAMKTCVQYLGSDLGCKLISAHDKTWRLSCGYAYFMATSGNAFFLSWKDGWHLDNIALANISEDSAAPYRHAFESVGYGYDLVRKAEADEAAFRSRITESLQRGRPVLAFGVVGPPVPSIITGYDDAGDVLIGWSFFQGFPQFGSGLEFEPSGEFRKREWFADTEGLLLFGDKLATPDPAQVLRDTLRWGLQVARTPMVNGRHNGFAAYKAWAEHLTHAEDFATEDEALLRERHRVHDDAIGAVAEGRWYGAQFLREMAEQARSGALAGFGPAAADGLLAAALCFETEHDLMWAIWAFAGGNGCPEAYRNLAQPFTRERIVPIIHLAREKDEQAADHLERAISAPL